MEGRGGKEKRERKEEDERVREREGGDYITINNTALAYHKLYKKNQLTIAALYTCFKSPYHLTSIRINELLQ